MVRHTTRTAARRVVQSLTAILTFVPTLAHELCHLLAAAPWADSVHVSVSIRRADAQAGIDWRGGAESVPNAAIWLSAYAPALVGAVAGIWGAARLLSGGVPTEPSTLLLGGVLAIWWAVFALPSGADRDHSASGADES